MASMWRKAMVYLGLGPDEEYEQFGAGAQDGRPVPGTAREPSAGAARPTAQGRPAQARPAEGHDVKPSVAPQRPAQPGQRQAGPRQPGQRQPGQRQAGPRQGAPGAAGAGTSAPARGASRREQVQSHVEELPPPPGGQGQFETSTVRPVPAQSMAEPPKPKARTVVRAVPAASAAKPHTVIPTSFNNAQDVADRFKAGQPVIVNLQSVERELARRLIDFSSGLCYGLGGHMEKVANQVYLLTPDNVEVSAEERRRMSRRGSDEA